MNWKTKLAPKLRCTRPDGSGSLTESTTGSKTETSANFFSGRDSDSQTSASTAVPDQRWSECVPPDTALAFGAVWDPVFGIIGFSSAEFESTRWVVDNEIPINEVRTPTSSVYSCSVYSCESATEEQESELESTLNNSCSYTPEPPKSPIDMRSQVLTLGTWTIAESDTLAVLDQLFDRDHDALSSPHRGHTQASSALLNWSFELDAQTNVAKKLEDNKRKPCRFSDEGFFETMGDDSMDSCEGQGNLCSAFSVTTTSTSRYISVERDPSMMNMSEDWSTLEPPQNPMLLGNASKFPGEQPPPPRRRLTKQSRRDRPPAPVSQVLNRPNFNHTQSSPPKCSKNYMSSPLRRVMTDASSSPNSKTSASHKSHKSSRPSLRSAFSFDSKPLNHLVQKWKQGAPAERWVRIDVDHVRGIVRQCYVPPPLL